MLPPLTTRRERKVRRPRLERNRKPPPGNPPGGGCKSPRRNQGPGIGNSYESYENFVVPGTAIGGTGIGPNSSFSACRFSWLFIASSQVTALPV